ncbi:hypothetical protein VPH35_130776 [Triticum aestivum]
MRAESSIAMEAEPLLKHALGRLSLFPTPHEPSNPAAAPAGMDGRAESSMARQPSPARASPGRLTLGVGVLACEQGQQGGAAPALPPGQGDCIGRRDGRPPWTTTSMTSRSSSRRFAHSWRRRVRALIRAQGEPLAPFPRSHNLARPAPCPRRRRMPASARWPPPW